MAYITANTTPVFPALRRDIASCVAEALRVRTSRNTLTGLSDRALKDIGLTRQDVVAMGDLPRLGDRRCGNW